MGFCPLRSTAEKQVECSENCAWYFKSKDNKFTCEISHLADRLNKVANNVDDVANQIYQKD